MGRRDSAWRLSRPKTRARPAVWWVQESSILTNVVLPAPFGPSSPKVDPTGTRSEISSTARSSRLENAPRKTLVKPSVSIAYSGTLLKDNERVTVFVHLGWERGAFSRTDRYLRYVH